MMVDKKEIELSMRVVGSYVPKILSPQKNGELEEKEKGKAEGANK